MPKRIRRSVVRKIKNGRIRAWNHVWKPDESSRLYDNRLEGLPYVFICHDSLIGTMKEDFINMSKLDPSLGFYPDGPEYGPEVVDGRLPWSIWIRADV